VQIGVNPVLAGTGAPAELLWRDGLRARLELVGTRALRSGAVIVSYRPAS
jgi:hypothetical protein